MSSLALVSAYDSESDEEGPKLTSTEARECATQVQPAHGNVSATLGLPPPKRQQAAKRQFVVEAAPKPIISARPPEKRMRSERSEQSGMHSLLGSLPAPQNKLPKRAKVEEKDEEALVDDDQRLTVHETNDVSQDKGNEDFRAMLGLAPKAPKATSSKPRVIVCETKASQAAPEEPPKSPHKVSSLDLFSAAPHVEDTAEPEPEPEPEHEQSDPYRGWKCDPDGTWYPVTPAAHAAYAAWMQQQQQQQQYEVQASESVPWHARLDAFDASAELEGIPRAPPPEPTSSKPERENLVSEKLRTDKFTNMRARTRGQLTSLLAMAHESRPMLEERWAQGKSKMRENKKRYGF